jgi:hypothetical protein
MSMAKSTDVDRYNVGRLSLDRIIRRQGRGHPRMLGLPHFQAEDLGIASITP